MRNNSSIETDPNNLTAKYNQALYAMYAGKFDDGAGLRNDLVGFVQDAGDRRNGNFGAARDFL